LHWRTIRSYAWLLDCPEYHLLSLRIELQVGERLTCTTLVTSSAPTQERVIKLFVEELGYRYLSDWSDRDNNSNVEAGILSTWLAGRGSTPAQIGAALYKLRTEADNYSRISMPTTRPSTSCCAMACR